MALHGHELRVAFNEPRFIRTNIHPNWRSIGLAYIRQVRRTLKEGRYTASCLRVIKETQRDLLSKRNILQRTAQEDQPHD